MENTSVETGDARQSLKSQFFCPNCSTTMEVKINKKSSTAEAICPKCGLKYETSFKSELTEPVDIYSELMDKLYKSHRVRDLHPKKKTKSRDSISIKINEDGTGIVEIGKDTLEWREKVNFLEEAIEGLKKAVSGLEFAASWARKATYQAMSNQILSLKSTVNTRINEILKEIDILSSNITQTRLI